MKGPWEAHLAAKVGIAGSSVENQNRFSTLQFLLELFDSDAVFRLSENRLGVKEEPAADQEQGEKKRLLT
jgi:hypothetical protein